MSDKETIIEMFRRSNIEYKEYPKDDKSPDSLRVEKGYAGFVSVFSFDDNGMLLSVEAYE